MKKDVLALAEGQSPLKTPTKETLNHAGIVSLASGLDPFRNTAAAYRLAYKNLGIDVINRVPENNAPVPLEHGETRDMGNGYVEGPLGIYNTYFRVKFPFKTVEEFWKSEINLNYNDLITPVPHKLDRLEITHKMNLLGEIGLYYYMLYTTLFMWGVEYLGWEIFLTAAALDPDGFNEKFLEQAFLKSYVLVKELSEVDSPFVFCHDDLADARGPVFNPEWYQKYIFPKYIELWKPVKKKGKKIIFVADGNMSLLLKDLKKAGVDGVMLENPATDFDLILDFFNDGIIIGGIETAILYRGSPKEIKTHVKEIHSKVRGIKGYVMSTPGGIHGQIPLANLEAYFDARAELGYTPENWRNP